MVYFTVIAPYVLIAVFLWRALTLDGAYDGLRFLFTPRWELLKDAKVGQQRGVVESQALVARRQPCLQAVRMDFAAMYFMVMYGCGNETSCLFCVHFYHSLSTCHS